MKKRIKLGVMAVVILFIPIFALFYVSTILKGEDSSTKPVLSRVEGLTTGGGKSTLVAQHSHEMQGMQQEGGTETQMQGTQKPPEFIGIEINPEKQQLIGIKTEEVVHRKLVKNIRTVGIVQTDERKIAHVHVKFSGWIKDMFVYEGQYVKHGAPLFTIYSPE
ncbi:MAG TPA: efflux RND transporter periplasmic adaptor subunit, partial [Thermodesulfobacteriota bacterium]